MTAFVSPATGESFWCVSNGAFKPFFEALLRVFAEEAGAGRERRIILTLDNAGWHGEAGLAVPGGVRLVFQPAYTPEVQPAETLWTLIDEPVVNKHIPSLEDLDEIISADAPPLPANLKKSRAKPTSTCGQKSPTRGDRAESVSDWKPKKKSGAFNAVLGTQHDAAGFIRDQIVSECR